MKDLLKKLSSYNIFNYLLPGVIFVFLANVFTKYNFVQEDFVFGFFLYYFIGLIISRVGSLFVEPLLKKMRFIRFASYESFLTASKKDEKLLVLSEENNMYRTLCALFVLLGLLKAYDWLTSRFPQIQQWSDVILIIVLFALLLFSYRKQCQYITKRTFLTSSERKTTMGDFFEIDFLNVGTEKSGDAIPLRYQINGQTRIHVTDGGYQSTGTLLVNHINCYYGNPTRIDAVIVSHPDGDHAGGLRKLFDEFEISELWMLRPWLYADELIDRISRFTSVENLKERLKELYPNLVALEELADEHGVDIYEPFQGAVIGHFTVMAPTKDRYLDLVVKSDKTPEAKKIDQALLRRATGAVITLIPALWGQETFPPDDTSAENNMSVIQYAKLCGKKILLTADAGRAALEEAADYAPSVRLDLPGIDRIQVPHHGSRHNVSTELLDQWLGPKLDEKPASGSYKYTAVVSAAKDDKDHPRNTVVRAFIHRGCEVLKTKGFNLYIRQNAPDRDGWVAAEPVPYPEDEEEI